VRAIHHLHQPLQHTAVLHYFLSFIRFFDQSLNCSYLLFILEITRVYKVKAKQTDMVHIGNTTGTAAVSCHCSCTASTLASRIENYMNPANTFRLGSALVLLYKNDLTHELCQPVKEHFETLVAVQDYQHVVVDLSEMGAIDESGLHLLVYLNSRVRGHGKILYLLSPPRHFL